MFCPRGIDLSLHWATLWATFWKKKNAAQVPANTMITVQTSSTYTWPIRKPKGHPNVPADSFRFQHETIVNIPVLDRWKFRSVWGSPWFMMVTGFCFVSFLFALCSFQALLSRLKCRGCTNCLAAGLLAIGSICIMS